MNPWLIAWRSLMRRKLRTLLTLLSIVIGVGSTFAVIASVNTAKLAFPLYLKAAFGKADYTILGTEAYFPEELHKSVGRLEGTAAVAVLNENTRLQLDKEGITDIQKRIDLKGYSRLDTPITNFRLVKGDLSRSGAVITDRTAKVWQSDIGDTIALNTSNGVKQIPITAIVKYTVELMGPSSWTMAKYHPWTVAVPLADLQQWFGLQGKVEGIQVKSLDPSRTAELEHTLEHAVAHDGSVYIQPVIIDADTQFKDAETFFMALYIAGFLGIVLSAVVIFNSFYVSITERKKEFAALKTIGYTPAQLRGFVLNEALLLAAAGTAVGLLIGYGLALLLKAAIFLLFGIHDQSGLQLLQGLIIAALTGLLIPLAASLYPIRQAGKVSVIAVLKEQPSEKPPLSKGRAIAGILLIGSAFFIKHLLMVAPLLLGIILVYPYLFRGFASAIKPLYRLLFGFSGEVAARNLLRNLGRTSMTSVILSLGIAMIVLMSSLNSAMIQSYERVIHASYGGSLDVMFHHIEKTDLAQLKSTAGVADAQTYPLQAAIWSLNGHNRKLPVYGVGADWIDRFPLFTARQNRPQSELIRSLQPDELALDNIAFGVWGGKLGDTITLETLQGARPFRVAAVVETMKNSGYGAFMSDETFRRSFGLKYERNALVIKDDKTSPLQLRENIFNQFGSRIEEMFGPEDWVSVVGATLTGSFSVIHFLVVLSIIISGMGITNTLLMNIMERVRELGMMRAVGLAQKQIVRMVLLEGLGIGAAATAVGLLFGTLLIYMTSTFMNFRSLTFTFGVSGWMLAAIALFGLAVSLMASFTPASRAAKTHLSEALRYE
ncbi:FtsX-like permease family protein [Paenibacillus chartarius]|uniref:FtsX-like permease family protein n=1 Tax=Paenibacillus chartarius TaxID=747481 RepID=A0ABV6DGP0_9BACL